MYSNRTEAYLTKLKCCVYCSKIPVRTLTSYLTCSTKTVTAQLASRSVAKECFNWKLCWILLVNVTVNVNAKYLSSLLNVKICVNHYCRFYSCTDLFIAF